VRQKCTVVLTQLQLKTHLTALFSVLRGLKHSTVLQAYSSLKHGGSTRSLRQKLEALERDKDELVKQLSKGEESSRRSHPILKELQEENRGLKEKLVQTEKNVGVFVKEMASLLDQHQPEGFRRAEVEAAINKVRRPVKGRARSRVNPVSPEREGIRRGDRSNKVQFD
jgi:predicted nuclease with TOPRIM domain